MTDLVIAHLYPDLLRTYGDRDNVMALSRRAEWRGFTVRVVGVGLGEPIPGDAGVVVLGGGTDSVQGVVGREIASRAVEIRTAIERDAVVLGICGGFQLLGTRYILADGHVIPGMGVLDAETRASDDRIVGRVLGWARLWGGRSTSLGSRTTVGAPPWDRQLSRWL
jgi:CobQ-like glutamine amidotransferase family enzyme